MNDAALRLAAERARNLVEEAGALVLKMQDTVTATEKGGDQGIVTEADLAAEELLLAGLREHFPGDAILSEETCPTVDATSKRIWCVDPIDGTQEYADGLGEYAVMVGLLEDGVPVAVAFAIPSEELVLWGWRGGGAFADSEPLELAALDNPSAATAIHSRSRLGDELSRALDRIGPAHRLAAGGVGYKVAQILLGRAHLYIHAWGGTSWWDSAAPAAVLLAAGGFVSNAKGGLLTYRDGFRHEDGLLFTAPGLGEAVVRQLRT